MPHTYPGGTTRQPPTRHDPPTCRLQISHIPAMRATSQQGHPLRPHGREAVGPAPGIPLRSSAGKQYVSVICWGGCTGRGIGGGLAVPRLRVRAFGRDWSDAPLCGCHAWRAGAVSGCWAWALASALAEGVPIRTLVGAWLVRKVQFAIMNMTPNSGNRLLVFGCECSVSDTHRSSAAEGGQLPGLPEERMPAGLVLSHGRAHGARIAAQPAEAVGARCTPPGQIPGLAAADAAVVTR